MGIAVCAQELIFSNRVSLGVLAVHSRTGPAPVVSRLHICWFLFVCFGTVFAVAAFVL